VTHFVLGSYFDRETARGLQAVRRLADPGGTFSGEVVSATALRFHWDVVPMFTALIGDVSREFDLGTRAAALVNELLRFIARTPGGLAGFIARFEAADMSLLTSSWLGNSESEPMTAGELEGALGADGLRRIGRKGYGSVRRRCRKRASGPRSASG
jgi:hypothetical protein